MIMKIKSDGFLRLASFFLLALSNVFQSCDIFDPESSGNGELKIAFASSSDPYTRADAELPDTNDFLLKVVDSKGNTVYDGSFGACPESLPVAAGSYVVTALSGKFEKPAFASPQYGDEQCVVVPDGGVADVLLTCRQMNAGVKLRIDRSFLTECPDGVLFLKSDDGKLMYSYSEKRIAYFKPGKVSLMLSRGSVDQVLMSRTLAAQEILSLGVSAASTSSSQGGQASSRLSIELDTLRNWVSDRYVIGGESTEDEYSDALTISQAKMSVGDEDVWISGYIVGGDLSSSSASFETPFKSRTNIMVGPKSSTKDRDACLSVQLPSGELRDALNLVDNPDMLGARIYLRGDIVESYYGLTGVKNVSEYRLP